MSKPLKSDPTKDHRQFEGELVRLDKIGVGVVDVKDADEFIYFNTKHIRGYRGETIDELTAPMGGGGWTKGKTVVVDGDMDRSGNVHVTTVRLK